MSIMIHDEDIIAGLTELASRYGTTKAEALRRALLALKAATPLEEEGQRFARDRVEVRTSTLGSRYKRVQT